MTKPFSLSLVALALAACADTLQPTDPTARVSGGFAAASNGAADAATHLYDVTITNLTSGQPFSPGVIVTHTKDHALFRVGSAASEGIRLIAEDGSPAVALAEQTGQPGVFDVVVISAPVGCVGCPGPFGSSATYRISARAAAHRLSLATMLICTNDGFTGLHGIKLPGGFQPATFTAAGYDAGTEANDERSTSIVDPCFAIGPTSRPGDGNTRPATASVIALHPGIAGVGDLVPALHGWTNPVARITVQRVK